MKSTTLIRINALVIVFLLSAFSTITYSQPMEYYTPKALLLPGHSQPKQFFASVGFDGGIDLNLSYSLPHNFVIFTTGNLNVFTHQRNESSMPQFKISKNDNAFTVGFGYRNFDKHNFINILEYYSGFGFTSIDNFRRLNNSTSESFDQFTQANYLNGFLQINGLVKRKKIEYGFAARLAYIEYDSFSYFMRSQANITRSISDFRYINLEPALSFSYLIAQLKGNFQLGISIPLYSEQTKLIDSFDIEESVNYSDFYFFYRISIQLMKDPAKGRR